jgi:outer membrane lipoprotein-sorting protein
MKYGTILLILLMGFAFGCAQTITEGTRIDEAKVKDFMARYNTADQVTQAFGKPYRVEKLPSGEDQFLYRYYYKDPHWWTTDDIEEQNLKIVVKDNEVQSYNYRKGTTEKITKE